MKFIILTDHGDATRVPDPPQYRSGVLCIDAVEINSTGGHIVGLGLGGPSPYPLAGAPADVIDDIHRMGGKAVVAHPDSPKIELSWRGPNDRVRRDRVVERGFGVAWQAADGARRDRRAVPVPIAGIDRVALRSACPIDSTLGRERRDTPGVRPGRA